MEGPLSCEQCDELLPGYALHALEPDEAAAVAEHLVECTRCPAQLSAYEDALYHLAGVVEPQEPPVDLAERIRASIQPGETTSVTPAPPISDGRRSHKVSRWALVLATTSVFLLASTLWLAWRLWIEAPRTRTAWQQVVQQLDTQRQALLLLAGAESQRSLLRADGKAAQGTLLLQPTTTEAVLIVQELPQLAPGRVYQLWLIRDGVRDNGGTFGVDQNGFGMLVIHAPQPLATYRAAGITEEPSGGSPGPTTPRVIGGTLSR
jgi:anti-sigma-K factor RskA